MRILIYGLAKSGTTILAARVQASLEEHCDRKVSNSFEPKELRQVDESLEYVKGDKKQRSVDDEVVKTLFDSGVPADQILKHQNHFDKKIFITRDPRDRYISQVFYRWHAGHNPDENKFRRTLDLAMLKESRPDSVPFVFLANQNPSAFPGLRQKLSESYEPVIKFLKQLTKDWYVIRYEDFVDGNVEGLEEYLGFPIKRNVGVSDAHKRVVRSKSYGNWRRWFTADDVGYLKPAFHRYLEFAGYDIKDWNLDPVANLPKAEGSDYMKKLFHGNTTRSIGRRGRRLIATYVDKILQSRIRHRLFPRVAPAEPRLFIHIPKAAGSSFRESLRLSIGNDNLFPVYPNRKQYVEGAIGEHLTLNDDPISFRQFLSCRRNPWVIGHVNHDKYRDLIPPENTFTFVRHPVDRLVSLYKHKRRHKGLSMSFEEFVDQERVHNIQSKHLPLEYVSKVAFVGLSEEYSASLNYLNWRYGLKLSEVRRQVSPKSQKVDVPQGLFDKICQMSSEDLAIYNAAKALFKEKISAMNAAHKSIEAQ